MSLLPAQILALMPSGIKAFIEGSSRRDLLRKVDTCLLVFDNQVAQIETGAVIEFQTTPGPIDYGRLALACKALLGADARKCSILLLVPPSLCIATHQKLAGITSESVVSALLLQSDSLLPANEHPVTLAINPKATDLSEEPIAIWMRSETMAEIFAAFAQQDLFIAAIKPRVLNLESSGARYLDKDASTLTVVESNQNVVQNWLQTNQVDLEQAAFLQQWQDALTDDDRVEQIELSSIEQYFELADKFNNQDYSFFPQGALQARRQVEKGRKLMVAAAAVAAALFLSSIPFLVQSIQFRSLAATLQAQRELSFEARQDQAIVVSFENELGPINDFPDQRVREAMFNLQNALSPNRLSSLEITDGSINIQGTSAEPQAILQQLEQDPMFTEVAFSRATNNDRYNIGLRLSTVNFDAYLVRYFPEQ